MKSIILSFLLVLRFIALFAQGTRQDSIALNYINAKINYDYKHCLLTVTPNNDKWVTAKGNTYLPVTATIINNSDDTLKYASELCFQGIFMGGIDNKNLNVDGQPETCTKNWPTTEIILPHSSQVFNFTISKKQGVENKVEKFRLNFYLTLVKVEAIDYMLNVMLTTNELLVKQIESARKKRTHVIWSNRLKI